MRIVDHRNECLCEAVAHTRDRLEHLDALVVLCTLLELSLDATDRLNDQLELEQILRQRCSPQLAVIDHGQFVQRRDGSFRPAGRTRGHLEGGPSEHRSNRVLDRRSPLDQGLSVVDQLTPFQHFV